MFSAPPSWASSHSLAHTVDTTHIIVRADWCLSQDIDRGQCFGLLVIVRGVFGCINAWDSHILIAWWCIICTTHTILNAFVLYIILHHCRCKQSISPRLLQSWAGQASPTKSLFCVKLCIVNPRISSGLDYLIFRCSWRECEFNANIDSNWWKDREVFWMNS